MATVPSPRTWTVGELCTAAKLNTDIRDGINFLLAPPFAHLTKSSSQSINSSSHTALTWDTEQIDRDGGHSTVTNTNRYTAQTAGWYRLTCGAAWNAAPTGDRQLHTGKNGGANQLFATIMSPTSGSNLAMQDISAVFTLAVNDYVEIFAFQSSGSALSISSGTSTGTGGGWIIQWIST